MASSVVSDNFETSTGAIPNMGGADVTTRLCSAWVNFNGVGTVAIRDSYNVSSITDNGTGDYTVNFTTAMSDINYSPSCSMGDNGSTSAHFAPAFATSGILNVASIRVLSAYSTAVANRTLLDTDFMNVQIFR